MSHSVKHPALVSRKEIAAAAILKHFTFCADDGLKKNSL